MNKDTDSLFSNLQMIEARKARNKPCPPDRKALTLGGPPGFYMLPSSASRLSFVIKFAASD